MVGYMLEIASQVAVLFIMIAVGFVMFKSGGVKASFLPGFTTLLLYVVTPALLINSMLSVKFSMDTLKELGIVFGVAFAVHFAAWAITVPLFKSREQRQRVVYRAAVILSNAGFMSLPLANALVGSKGVFLVSVYVMVFNIISWTLVYRMFNPGNFNLKKLLLNPGIIGVAVGAFFFFTGIALPEFAASAVRYIAEMNTPLAMIVIGGMIATGGIAIKKEEIPSMMLSISLRLLIVPAIALGAMLLIGSLEGELIFSIMIPICAPVAANSAMFAGQFGADGPLGSRLLAVSTVLSVVTMPVVLALARLLAF
jgi:predicted permease